jgi:xylulokinase
VHELIDREAAEIAPGCDGVTFVPTLAGERCPVPNPRARGSLHGISLATTQAHLARAVLEGVAASMGACLELIRAAGIEPPEVIGAGGGLGSPLWAQMHADAFGIPIRLAKDHEGSARGAALLAGLGVGATPALAVETPLLSGACVSPRLDGEVFWSRQRAWQTLLQRNALP